MSQNGNNSFRSFRELGERYKSNKKETSTIINHEEIQMNAQTQTQTQAPASETTTASAATATAKITPERAAQLRNELKNAERLTDRPWVRNTVVAVAGMAVGGGLVYAAVKSGNMPSALPPANPA